MKHGRGIAMLFEMDGKFYATTLDARSRLRFKKLIREYVPNGKVFDTAESGKQFSFIGLQTVLESVEKHYEALSGTQAGEHIARRVLDLTSKIRLQNDDSYEGDEDDDEE